MKHLPSLNTLHIEDNPISDKGAQALLTVADGPGKKLFLTTGVGKIGEDGAEKPPKMELEPHFLKDARKYIHNQF